MLEAYDQVSAATAQPIYVSGEVTKPGPVPLGRGVVHIGYTGIDTSGRFHPRREPREDQGPATDSRNQPSSRDRFGSQPNLLGKETTTFRFCRMTYSTYRAPR